MDINKLFTHATEFAFYPKGAEHDNINGHHHCIRVAKRSPGKWAVLHMGQCWNGEDWVYEGSPSGRTDEFKSQTRFTFDEAVAIALSKVETQTVNGRTYAQWQEHFQALDEAKAKDAQEEKSAS